MSIIQAVYRNGKFEPLEPVDLPEEERVQVHVSPTRKEIMEAWLKKVIANKEKFVKKHGFLPDSTPDIAEDRLR